MMRRFAGAVQFLTVLPIRAQVSTAGEAAVFFPLTGALLGVAAGLVFAILENPLGRSLAALLSIAFLIMATGALHEDGLADVADAIRAHRSYEKIMAILKDSRIGTYGALALIVTVVLRWQALAQCQINPVWGLVAAVTLSRTALVVLAGMTPTVGEGLGAHFAAAISKRMVLIVSVQGVAAVLLCSPKRGLILIAAATLAIVLSRWYFIRRLGGVNGDCLGACCQMTETMCLILLAWQPSF